MVTVRQALFYIAKLHVNLRIFRQLVKARAEEAGFAEDLKMRSYKK